MTNRQERRAAAKKRNTADAITDLFTEKLAGALAEGIAQEAISRALTEDAQRPYPISNYIELWELEGRRLAAQLIGVMHDQSAASAAIAAVDARLPDAEARSRVIAMALRVLLTEWFSPTVARVNEIESGLVDTTEKALQEEAENILAAIEERLV